jgi:hypothetical protein
MKANENIPLTDRRTQAWLDGEDVSGDECWTDLFDEETEEHDEDPDEATN